MNLTQNEYETLTDVIVDSEYYASLCGFHYPDAAKVHGNAAHYQMSLRGKIVADKSNPDISKGLMVWQNKSYIPSIEFVEQGNEISVSIVNEDALPYPVIQITKSWINSLNEYYIAKKEAKKPTKDLEIDAQLKFLESIQEHTTNGKEES